MVGGCYGTWREQATVFLRRDARMDHVVMFTCSWFSCVITTRVALCQVVEGSDIGCCTRCYSAANRRKSVEEIANAIFRIDLFELAFARAYAEPSQQVEVTAALQSKDYVVAGLAGREIEDLVDLCTYYRLLQGTVTPGMIA